jgi:transposase
MPDPKTRFTPEFRAEAVRLAQTSGRSRREIAADLGIGLSTLRNWIDRRATERWSSRLLTVRRTWRPS